MELTPGGMLGRYRLLERAGAGGMAEVWKAVQPSLDRVVAIKVLPRHLASEPGFLERFRREARAISRLDHPNILGIHDFGEDDGFTYMVMPFLAGGTLSPSLGRPWSVEAAVRTLEPLAAALEYAHAHGIIHRDVKPSNVLIGEGGRVVLADFGIARITEASLAVSGAGTMVGTPAYMSPEQAQGIPATPASDQYSLGVVSYQMLTGRRPFEAETPLAIALAHIHRPLPAPHTMHSSITPAVEAVLCKVLEKEPGDRYPDVSAFVSALREADQEAPAVPGHTADAASTMDEGPVSGTMVLSGVAQMPASAPGPTVSPPAIPGRPALADDEAGPAPSRIPTTLLVVGALCLVVLLGLGVYALRSASPNPRVAATAVVSGPIASPISAAAAGDVPTSTTRRLVAPTAPQPTAPQPTATVPPPSPTVEPARYVRVASTNGPGVFLREEPGLQGQRILPALAENAVLRLLGPEQTIRGQVWRLCEDERRGVRGWILAQFLEDAANPATAADRASPSTTAGH